MNAIYVEKNTTLSDGIVRNYGSIAIDPSPTVLQKIRTFVLNRYQYKDGELKRPGWISSRWLYKWIQEKRPNLIAKPDPENPANNVNGITLEHCEKFLENMHLAGHIKTLRERIVELNGEISEDSTVDPT